MTLQLPWITCRNTPVVDGRSGKECGYKQELVGQTTCIQCGSDLPNFSTETELLAGGKVKLYEPEQMASGR
ncbi:hypothetical protein H0W91_00815 [Patescibacteria group bacterium]|nr:hypothetical protein [Patescibacteria group bacterium]